MPDQIGIAVITALLNAGAAGGVAVAAGAVATIGTYAAGAYLLNRATEALAPSPAKREGGGIELNYAGTDERRRLIYGVVQVGGMQTIPPIATGSDGRLLHLVLTLAGHECDSVVYVQFDKDIINWAQIGAVTGTDDDGVVGGGNRYADKAWIRAYLGTASQTADYILTQAYPTAFDADFRGRGITYLAVRLRAGGIYPGLPNITAMVKGKKCYDPRTGTTVWTSNPFIIARDYLLTDGGESADNIDDASVIAAANIADQVVAIPTASTQKRYMCNIVLESAATTREFEDNLKRIVDTGRGRAVKRDGTWYFYAGAWDVPSVTINDADWVGPTSVRVSAPPEERWNAMRVWYLDAAREFQRVECYPRRNTTYVADDGGEEMWNELELTGVTSEYEAQRHGEFALRAGRNQITKTGRLRPEFFRLATWDTVAVNDTEYGWVSKGFRVAAMDLTPTGECDVTLVEEGSALWTDLAENEYNAITTWPTIDPGASVPQARTGFTVTPQPGAIGFTWDKPAEPIPGEQTRLLEGINDTLTSALEVWRGDSTGVIMHKTGDQITRYYWAQGVVGSYTGQYTPNSFGTAGAAYPWTPDALVVQLSLPTAGLPATVAGTVLDYSPAQGNVQVRVGGLSQLQYASIAATSAAGCVGAANSADNSPVAGKPKGHYQITDITSNVGVLWMTVVYSSATHVLPFMAIKLQQGAQGVIGPPGATIVSNGMMNHVDSATGLLAGWTNGLASVSSGVNGGPCLYLPNSPAYISVEHAEYIPVDMIREQLLVQVKATQTVSGARLLYLGFACYDNYGQCLGYQHESWNTFAKTMLASSMNQLFVYKQRVIDYAVWNVGRGYPAPNLMAIMPFDGVAYEVNSLVCMDKQFDRQVLTVNTTDSTSYDILTVSSDWWGAQVPPNFYFPLGQLGSTHKYFYYAYPPSVWQTISGTILGPSTPWERFRGMAPEQWALRHRTRYVRPYIYAPLGTGDVYVDEFNVQRAPVSDELYANQGRMLASGHFTYRIIGHSEVASVVCSPHIRFQPYSGPSGNGCVVFDISSGFLGSYMMANSYV